VLAHDRCASGYVSVDAYPFSSLLLLFSAAIDDVARQRSRVERRMSENEKPPLPAAATRADGRPKARFIKVWRASRAAVDIRESMSAGDAPASRGAVQSEPARQPRRERPRASPVRKPAANQVEPIPLVAYLLDGHRLEIRPAPAQRDWMEATHERFAVRCLPLSIANGYGWELVCSAAFAARWNGGTGKDAVIIEADGGGPAIGTSHFGHGILTFHVPCLFRTAPGFDLLVGGPINRPKDGISPLSAIVETDWAPYSFTMNWMFTRAGAVVRFEKDEPFCHILPLRRADLEATAPKLRLLSEDPELQREHMAWQESRRSFNAGLELPGSPAHAEKWQKNYHRGLRPDGSQGGEGEHRTRVRLEPFRRGTAR
jgi:hypothetical protein